MATERKAQKKLAEFINLTSIGQCVAGQVKLFGSNSNGPFVVFEPVLLCDDVNDAPPKWERYASVALGLSADLKAKLDDKKDVGKILRITFDSEERTKWDNNRKVMLVEELDREEIRAIASPAENKVGEPLPTWGGGNKSEPTQRALF